MKVAIIGGGGLVGSCTGFALQTGRVVREIALLDANAEMANGQALDLLHGSALVADQVITAGGYEHIPTSDVICITAGLRRKPDESRLDLINRNVDLFLSILGEVAKAGPKKDVVVVVVSNPVDVLTYLACKRLGLPASQVIGLGTQLDTLRFRSLIAAKLNAPPKQVSALILGEHGDSMVPIWSSATVAGLPLERYPGWSINLQNELFTRTKGSGAEVIKKKEARVSPSVSRFRKSSKRSRSIAGRFSPFRRCSTAVMTCATLPLACRPSSAGPEVWASMKSNFGRRNCKHFVAAGKYCEKLLIRCSSEWAIRCAAAKAPKRKLVAARIENDWICYL